MKRLKELDEILKNSELTDKDAVELRQDSQEEGKRKRLVLGSIYPG
ncbi:hypothetical protein QDY65_04210 [Pyrococcus kukulkanii]